MERVLEKFCEKLELSIDLAHEMFQKGQEIIEATGNTHGVIFQLYDISNKFQSASDECTYLSMDYGYPVWNGENLKTSQYLNGELITDSDTQVQIRMVFSNEVNLNPNGPIRMKRYDSLPKGTREVIIKAMRETLKKHIPEDFSKIKEYKKRFDQLVDGNTVCN